MVLQKYYDALPYLIIISSFGIYFEYGIRLEHLIIYPSILFFIFLVFLSQKEVIKSNLFIFGLWLTLAIIGFFVALSSGGQITSIIADTESFIQPLALMILFMFVSVNNDEMLVSKKILKCCQTLVIMLSLNTIFIIISMFTDITQIGSLFWGSGDDTSVAYKAMTNGRYSGVFNQPMEAGIAYSIGLFTWLYLSEKVNTLKLKYVIVLFLMVIGGLVSVSKIFLLGGLLLFFIGVLFNKKIWKLISHLTFWALTVGTITYHFLFKTWSGLNYLLRFFNSNDSFLTLVTAGRVGENSNLTKYYNNVWNESPIFGRGFGGTEVYDSGFFYFFAVGGIIGLFTLISMMLFLVYLGLKLLKRQRFSSELRLFLLLTILILFSNIGAPVFTINRSSTVLWVFLGLLFQFFYFEHKKYKKIGHERIRTRPCASKNSTIF